MEKGSSEFIEVASEKLPTETLTVSTSKESRPNDEELNQPNIKKLIRKLDWNILPVVSFLYLISFLDRANIGNARLDGLEKDNGLHGLQYNVCLAVFYITYIIFEVPSNLILKLWRPSAWIAIIMASWGLTLCFMGFTHSYGGLIACRLILGATEAGLFPGVNYYITLWYKRKEIAVRMSIFFAAAALAGAFGGLLARAIVEMDGLGGKPGWAWIFIVEGAATVVIAVFAYFFIYDHPSTARFLKPHERTILQNRLSDDNDEMPEHFEWKFVWDAFLDYKIYFHMVIYLAILTPLYSYAMFLPTIIKNMGYTNTNSQLMSVPPYAIAAVCTIFTGFLSTRTGKTAIFIVIHCFLAVIGYAILIGTTKTAAQYVAVCFAAVGIYPLIPLCVAWNGSNIGGHIKRGVGMALQISVGNIGGIIGSFIYQSQDAPRYYRGHGVNIAMSAVAAVFAVITAMAYKHENKKKEENMRYLTPEERAIEARNNDRAVFFKYVY